MVGGSLAEHHDAHQRRAARARATESPDPPAGATSARTGASQGGCDRDRWHGRDASRYASDDNNPHCHDGDRRSSSDRARRQPCTAGRQRHGSDPTRRGDRRETPADPYATTRTSTAAH